MLLYLLGVVLLTAASFLFIKVRLLQKAMDEIDEQLEEHLSTDTNGLLLISSRDAHARRLAADLNSQLRLLRSQRRRYSQGDAELKSAVTNISHDLRTPLTAISGYLELLEKEELGEKAQGYVSVLRNRADVLQKLTEELFKYSVTAATENELIFEPLSVKAVLEESIAGFYAELKEKGIEPEIEMPVTSVERRLDREALYRVFGNVISNAVKYSAGGLRISLQEDGSVRFENRAPGLDMIQLEKLFDRFYTVESARKSTGLGLSIARLLTERMGGEIFAGLEDEMLCITVRFPA